MDPKMILVAVVIVVVVAVFADAQGYVNIGIAKQLGIGGGDRSSSAPPTNSDPPAQDAPSATPSGTARANRRAYNDTDEDTDEDTEDDNENVNCEGKWVASCRYEDKEGGCWGDATPFEVFKITKQAKGSGWACDDEENALRKGGPSCPTSAENVNADIVSGAPNCPKYRGFTGAGNKTLLGHWIRPKGSMDHTTESERTCPPGKSLSRAECEEAANLIWEETSPAKHSTFTDISGDPQGSDPNWRWIGGCFTNSNKGIYWNGDREGNKGYAICKQ